MTLVRGDRTTRNGSKRFAGIGEISVANGVMSPALVGSWEAVGRELFLGELGVITVQMEDDEGTPLGENYLEPIIWGGNSPSFPLGRFQRVIGIRVNPNISSQNTRKRGRGA